MTGSHILERAAGRFKNEQTMQDRWTGSTDTDGQTDTTILKDIVVKHENRYTDRRIKRHFMSKYEFLF